MKHLYRTMITLTSVVAAATSVVALSATAGAAPPAASSPGGQQKVIVVLRDQLHSAPATERSMASRATLAAATQGDVLRSLAGPRPGRVEHFSLGNAFTAKITATQADELSHDPRVAYVIPDAPLPKPPAAGLRAPTAPQQGAQQPATPNSDVCPADPDHPLVEPEALESINAYAADGGPNAQQLADGSGVTVAFLSSWDTIDPDNPNYIRPNGEHVFVDYQDFSGVGPSGITNGREAFGDASSIAAQGVVVHDLSQFVNQTHPLPPGCNIVIRGAAPGASLVGLTYRSRAGLLQAIDYAVTVDHVDVINESFAYNVYPDYSLRNALNVFNDAAVDAGVTITAAAGDAGITNTIGSPVDPKIIELGMTTDFRTYAQSGYGGFPLSNGQWTTDNVSSASSSGFTQTGSTIDLVGPGDAGWADCSPAYTSCLNLRWPQEPTDLQIFSGTSEAAPLTAGVAALVIDAYRSTHSGASPTPAVIKRIITGTARDLGMPASEQGAGLLDARAATEAALTYPGAHGPHRDVRSNLITSDDQLTLVGKAGQPRSGHVTVTNVGPKPVTVDAGARMFVPLSTSTRIVSFDATTLPTVASVLGGPAAYEKVAFTVPQGADRLLVRKTFAQTDPNDFVEMTLLDPAGRFSGYSAQQATDSPYANVDVRKPSAGTWTAVLSSASGPRGFHGDVDLQFSTQRTRSAGWVRPSAFRLAPGASRTVTATFPLPKPAGDTDRSITLAGSNGQRTTVSAILRTLIDTSSGGRFGGVITGGNGRGPWAPAETFSYAFDARSGHRDLAVALHLTDDADTVDAVLLDPNGELADVVSNIYLDEDYFLVQGSTLQMFEPDAIPGRWRLVVVVQNPVGGTALEKPYHGTVGFDPLQTHSADLPRSPHAVLPAGQEYTAHIAIRNNGTEPLALGLDPRLNEQQDMPILPFGGTTAYDLPADPADEPIYIVPPDTSRLTAEARSTLPAQVGLEESASGINVFGDLDAAQQGSSVSVASVSESRGFVTPGIWWAYVTELGPYTDAGPPPGSTVVQASMRTAAFDTTMTSDTDDPYLVAIDPTSDGFGLPAVIEPGESESIAVHIVPRGPAGQVVSGHINVVTEWGMPAGAHSMPFYTTGATVASIPYRYKIG